MIAVVQQPVARTNWRPGPPPTRGVTGLVVHVTEGSAPSAAEWFANPLAEVSAHFLVTLAGAVWQFVGIHDVAFGNGRLLRPTWAGLRSGLNPNEYTVSVEHEGDGHTPWPEAQLTASAVLFAWLAQRFALVPSPLTIPLHRELYAGKTCPGPAFDRAEHLGRVRQTLALSGASTKSLVTGVR